MAQRLPMKKFGDYKFLKHVSSGPNSQVFRGVHVPTETKVAIKLVSRKNHPSLERLHREADALRSVAHENIIMLLNILKNEDSVALVTGFVGGGSLLEYISKQQRLTEQEARPIFRQLMEAVEHCHQQHLVHRDLKPANILLDKEGNVKLAAFSVATAFREEDYLNTFCGTPAFMAPEMLRREKYVGPEVDIWSLGIVLYNMITGHVPFSGVSWEELRTNVTQGTYETPDYFSKELKSFLERFLTVDAKLRPTICELMQDTWIQTQDPPKPPRKRTGSASHHHRLGIPRYPIIPENCPAASMFIQKSSCEDEDEEVDSFLENELLEYELSAESEKPEDDSSEQAGQPHEKTRTPSVEEDQAPQGLARSLGDFFRSICCFLPPRKTCPPPRRRWLRSNKVVPVTKDS
nr:MAP/microtubule affinity-regulating kinase 3-like [Microcebus murinus]XP_012597077.1 MAP/microtubule affinity-regulating kinase 3-like [Microcebus murinus]XP_012597078.1 MAP/microtubule affinity-regulating kinase 3-like [Microcebus murinus]XP_020139290.1 MAP/microtubule affinity-regulating kinase 3-like [Microcebus murinus]XP_020139291.1 MAP/microtubule affinity-regulating kinase 3-like [Microcebus murinus]